jgi:Mg2+/citrate symporter
MHCFITPYKPATRLIVQLAKINPNDFGNHTMKSIKVPLFVSIFLVVKQIIHPLSDIDDVEFQVTHAEFINF